MVHKRGEGQKKIPKICPHDLWMTPKANILHLLVDLKPEHVQSFFELQGLGSTVSPLCENLKQSCQPVAKTKFTMIVPEIELKLDGLKRNQEIDTVILCGIETHVCIMATCIDLIHRGFNVRNFVWTF